MICIFRDICIFGVGCIISLSRDLMRTSARCLPNKVLFTYYQVYFSYFNLRRDIWFGGGGPQTKERHFRGPISRFVSFKPPYANKLHFGTPNNGRCHFRVPWCQDVAPIPFFPVLTPIQESSESYSPFTFFTLTLWQA